MDELTTMQNAGPRLTVLQAKFAAYLSWSQPFIHNLVSGVGEHVNNVVICNRTENLDRFPTSNVVRLQTRYLVTPVLAMIGATYLRRTHQPDLIHAHFGWSGIRALLLKQFLRIPLVVTFGGRDAGVQMTMEHFDRLYEVLLDATDQIICVSSDLRDQLVAAGVDSERIVVIRRGTDLQQFAYVDRSDRDATAPVRLLMVGRLVEKKGHRCAFEALARLKNEGLRFSLDIVGEGEDYRELRRLRDQLGLHDLVKFIGVTNHAGVRKFMHDADLFLHCSVTGEDGDCEGIPNVVVEAAATGLPIVATRHGGIVEPVRHEHNGLLVEERDADGLTVELRRLITDRSQRLELGRAGSEFMRAEFDLDKQVRQHVEIYTRLVQEYRTEPELGFRTFVPENFAELAHNAIHCHSNAREFSLAELAESLRGYEKLGAQFGNAGPTFLEQCYDLKRHIPQPIKFPLKLVLGRALVTLSSFRKNHRRQVWLKRRRMLDERVLEYFREGGCLSSDESEWNQKDALKNLPEKIRAVMLEPTGESGRPNGYSEIHPAPSDRNSAEVTTDAARKR